MRRAFFIILIIGILIGLFLRDLLPHKLASAKIVTIKSRNLDFSVLTKAKTTGELLKEQGFDDRGLNSDRLLTSGMTIEIKKPIKVILVDAGNERLITTQAVAVSDLLFEEKIALSPVDRVTPELGSFLAEDLKIIIDRIVETEVVERAEIPYKIELEHDPEVFYGQEEVISPGKAGLKEQKFLITYKNGVEIKRKLLTEKVLEKPVTEIRKFGTKIEVEESQEGQASWYSYKKCLCAAHPFYEFGRFVRVTSLSSGKSIIVKINDRGPELTKHPDRMIDLDLVAFKELAPLGVGIIGVKVELLKQ